MATAAGSRPIRETARQRLSKSMTGENKTQTQQCTD
uniref:Uncharacterized protein n=1 Tax=Anguilla anguilla TaxID=7936 RepID=A0A0E9REB8_ANGAN